jgi:hypothetical protein
MPYTLGNYGGVYRGSDMVYIGTRNLDAGMSLMTVIPGAKFPRLCSYRAILEHTGFQVSWVKEKQA